MSRSTQQLKELTAGVHLVILGGFTAVKNPDGTLKESETGEKLISVRFTDNDGKSFDKQYWVKGEREKEFNRMLAIANIDRTKYATFKEIATAATGARLWLSIREVYEVDGEDIVGEVSYQIFDYDPCLNPEKAPVKKGNPQNHPKGIASGDFIAYKSLNKTVESIAKAESTEYVHSNPTEVTQETVATNTQMDNIWEATKTEAEPKIDKKEVIAKAKEMIAKVESKVKEPKKDTDTINWDEF